MDSLISLDKKQRKDLLDGIAVLSRFFWGPDLESCQEILQSVYLEPFEALDPYINYKPADLFAELQGINEGFKDPESIFHYLEHAYVHLFINRREGIAAPLYASCYGASNAPAEKTPLMGLPAVMMKKRFESKGLSLGDNIHEPPDHLSIELEYLYFLLDKGWSDNDPALLSEAGSFAGENMLPWVTLLRDRIAGEKKCRFYSLITTLLVSILSYLAHLEPTQS